jgi:hypothetical protein
MPTDGDPWVWKGMNMAKQKDSQEQGGQGSEAPDSPTADPRVCDPSPPTPERPRFEVRHPTIVNGHFRGCVIRDRVGRTDDESVAAACRDHGCEVTDRAEGKGQKANGKSEEA